MEDVTYQEAISERFIPTHVGLISTLEAVAALDAIHPHTCGANGYIPGH